MSNLISSEHNLAGTNAIFAVTGASGWLGKTTLNLLWELLGEEKFKNQVYAFSSKDGSIKVSDRFTIPTYGLNKILELEHIDYLFHYAFITRDGINKVGLDTYIKENNQIIDLILQFVTQTKTLKGIFCTSSGAVYGLDHLLIDPDQDLLSNPYGALKLKEENLLIQAAKDYNLSCLICRVFSIMGEFITKPREYAVGDFVYQALTHQSIKILADRPVLRSYTLAKDLVYLALAYLLKPNTQGQTARIDSCGNVVEMEQLAQQVLHCLGISPNNIDRQWDASSEPSIYVGDPQKIDQLMLDLNLQFSSFEEQVSETATYLKNFWQL